MNMYYTNIQEPANLQKIFAASIKMFSFLKLAVKPGVYKNTDNKEWLVYLLSTITKNQTIIDIGSHRREYLFDMMKVANHSAKLIVFENNTAVGNYLLRMKQWLKLKNVIIERVLHSADAVPVINIKESVNKETKAAPALRLLDHYFLPKQLKPDILKIKIAGNEPDILKGLKQTLEMYKPKILLECRETQRSRGSLLATFKMLADLEYDGYFILDTMKIPLANFDFNIYQNEVYGFYCNNFLFE